MSNLNGFCPCGSGNKYKKCCARQNPIVEKPKETKPIDHKKNLKSLQTFMMLGLAHQSKIIK